MTVSSLLAASQDAAALSCRLRLRHSPQILWSWSLSAWRAAGAPAGEDLLGSLHMAGPQAMQQAQEEATLPDPLSMHLPRIATPSPLTQLPDPKRASLVQPGGAADPVPHTFHDQPQPEPAQRPPGTMAQAASLLAHTHLLSHQAQGPRGPYEADPGQTGAAAASQAQPRASPQPADAVHDMQGADAAAGAALLAGSSASVGMPMPDQTAHSHAEAQQPSLSRDVAGQQTVGQPMPGPQDQQHELAEGQLAEDELGPDSEDPQFTHTESEQGSSFEDRDAAKMGSASTSSVASPAPVPAIMAANPMYAAYSSTAPSSAEALQILHGSSPSNNGPVASSTATSSLIPAIEAASDDEELLDLLTHAQPDDPAPLDVALLSLTQSLSALERLASGSPFTV